MPPDGSWTAAAGQGLTLKSLQSPTWQPRAPTLPACGWRPGGVRGAAVVAALF